MTTNRRIDWEKHFEKRHQQWENRQQQLENRFESILKRMEDRHASPAYPRSFVKAELDPGGASSSAHNDAPLQFKPEFLGQFGSREDFGFAHHRSEETRHSNRFREFRYGNEKVDSGEEVCYDRREKAFCNCDRPKDTGASHNTDFRKDREPPRNDNERRVKDIPMQHPEVEMSFFTGGDTVEICSSEKFRYEAATNLKSMSSKNSSYSYDSVSSMMDCTGIFTESLNGDCDDSIVIAEHSVIFNPGICEMFSEELCCLTDWEKEIKHPIYNEAYRIYKGDACSVRNRDEFDTLVDENQCKMMIDQYLDSKFLDLDKMMIDEYVENLHLLSENTEEICSITSWKENVIDGSFSPNVSKLENLVMDFMLSEVERIMLQVDCGRGMSKKVTDSMEIKVNSDESVGAIWCYDPGISDEVARGNDSLIRKVMGGVKGNQVYQEKHFAAEMFMLSSKYEVESCDVEAENMGKDIDEIVQSSWCFNLGIIEDDHDVIDVSDEPVGCSGQLHGLINAKDVLTGIMNSTIHFPVPKCELVVDENHKWVETILCYDPGIEIFYENTVIIDGFSGIELEEIAGLLQIETIQSSEVNGIHSTNEEIQIRCYYENSDFKSYSYGKLQNEIAKMKNELTFSATIIVMADFSKIKLRAIQTEENCKIFCRSLWDARGDIGFCDLKLEAKLIFGREREFLSNKESVADGVREKMQLRSFQKLKRATWLTGVNACSEYVTTAHIENTINGNEKMESQITSRVSDQDMDFILKGNYKIFSWGFGSEWYDAPGSVDGAADLIELDMQSHFQTKKLTGTCFTKSVNSGTTWSEKNYSLEVQISKHFTEISCEQKHVAAFILWEMEFIEVSLQSVLNQEKNTWVGFPKSMVEFSQFNACQFGNKAFIRTSMDLDKIMVLGLDTCRNQVYDEYRIEVTRKWIDSVRIFDPGILMTLLGCLRAWPVHQGVHMRWSHESLNSSVYDQSRSLFLESLCSSFVDQLFKDNCRKAFYTLGNHMMVVAILPKPWNEFATAFRGGTEKMIKSFLKPQIGQYSSILALQYYA